MRPHYTRLRSVPVAIRLHGKDQTRIRRYERRRVSRPGGDGEGRDGDAIALLIAEEKPRRLERTGRTMALKEYKPGTAFTGVIGQTIDTSSLAWPRCL